MGDGEPAEFDVGERKQERERADVSRDVGRIGRMRARGGSYSLWCCAARYPFAAAAAVALNAC